MNFKMSLIGVTLMAVIGCSIQKKDDNTSKVKGDGDGIFGTSCNVQPVVRDAQGLNVCSWPATNWPGLASGIMFYSFPNNVTATDQAILACHQANALDEGVARGTSCYHLCEQVVHCLPFTSNP